MATVSTENVTSLYSYIALWDEESDTQLMSTMIVYRHISNSNNTYTIIIISIYNCLISVTTVCIVQSEDLFAFRSPLIHTPIIIRWRSVFQPLK